MAAESRNLIGPLTIELSTEVNCLRDFDPTAIAKGQPRNKSAEVKCVALINSRRSFSPENGVRFDASCLSPGAEKYSNSEVCILFYRIVSRNFHLTAFN